MKIAERSKQVELSDKKMNISESALYYKAIRNSIGGYGFPSLSFSKLYRLNVFLYNKFIGYEFLIHATQPFPRIKK
jgi:hypothetical protein